MIAKAKTYALGLVNRLQKLYNLALESLCQLHSDTLLAIKVSLYSCATTQMSYEEVYNIRLQYSHMVTVLAVGNSQDTIHQQYYNLHYSSIHL